MQHGSKRCRFILDLTDDLYADSIRRYFLNYTKCNIKPILIFDGGFDVSGKKLESLYKNREKKLFDVANLVKQGTNSGSVLPLLSLEVFIAVLKDLNIAYAQCDFEADDQIAALANYYSCPIISADSDFYIFDVHAGFININSIKLKVFYGKNSDRKKYQYLKCNIYHIDNFLSYFPGVDKSILPLFSTLVGNDYVDEYEFENFFPNIQLKYEGRIRLIMNSRQEKMMGLLCWLKNKSLNEVTDQVLEYLEEDKREYTRFIISRSVNSYELHHCNLCSIIDNKLYGSKIENLISERLTTPCGWLLPTDFILKVHSFQYNSFIINAVVSHKIFLDPIVEDFSNPSSFECSRYIRQVIYGILTRHDVDGRICKNSKCYVPIEESDRQGNCFQDGFVIPIYWLGSNVGKLPHLDELHNLEKEKGKLILASVLSMNADVFSNLPEKWQLLFGCCKYWLCNCNPHTTESFLYALIVNFIYFSLMEPESFVESNFKCPFKNSTEENHSCSSVICILSRITSSEIKYAIENLERYLYGWTFSISNSFSINIVHCYNQLQACAWSTLTLNKLLGCYVMNIDIHKCFNGTLLHNLTTDISSCSNPLLFVAELLGNDTALHMLFSALYLLLCQDVPTKHIIIVP